MKGVGTYRSRRGLEKDTMVTFGQIKHLDQCPRDNEKPGKNLRKWVDGSGWLVEVILVSF